MAPRQSAGLLLYRHSANGIEVLLGHMGGPFFAKRDEGAWSIPKGEYDADEEPLDAARREFGEEFGAPAPTGQYTELGTVTQKNGKRVTAWAVEGDLDASSIISNTFETEWPPKSGRIQAFPEVDRAEWLDLDTARAKMIAGQAALLDRLVQALR